MKILIIQTAFIGDLVLTTSFIREVFLKNKNAEIHILVKKGTEDILDKNPYLKKVYLYDKKKSKSLFYFINLINELRKEKFEITYSPHFSHRSSQISFFSGAKIRIGYKESGFSFLHTKKISRPLRKFHEVDKLFFLLGNEKNYSEKDKRPEIYFDESKILNIRNEINELKNFFVIAPSSLWETKRMPSEKFTLLIRKILQNLNNKIILVGSKQDKNLADEILKNFPNEKKILDFTGKTNLIELAYLISKSKLIVSNDSSPIHFASAFNIPTIMIYGATIPEFGYSTLSEKKFISEVAGLSCRPCGIHGGKFCPETHFKCMKDQDIEKIFLEIRKILAI